MIFASPKSMFCGIIGTLNLIKQHSMDRKLRILVVSWNNKTREVLLNKKVWVEQFKIPVNFIQYGGNWQDKNQTKE